MGKGSRTKGLRYRRAGILGTSERQCQATEKDKVGLEGQAWSHVDFILGRRERLASCLSLGRAPGAALEFDTAPTPQ